MDEDEFKRQRQFVFEVLNVIATYDIRVGGTQYSDKSYPISSLTNKDEFSLKLFNLKQVGLGTSISSGIKFCADEFKKNKSLLNKAIVMGDGFNNIRSNADTIAEANKVRSNGGIVSVVAEGSIDNKLLSALANNDASLQYIITKADVDRLAENIEKLTVAICGTQGKL